jgi:hypothetical protein
LAALRGTVRISSRQANFANALSTKGAKAGKMLEVSRTLLPFFAVPSLEIVHSLEDSSRIPQRLCRAVYADAPLRRHADTIVIFGCVSAALSLGVFA